MASFATEQEAFWAGDFGDEYTKRNRDEVGVSANVMLFAKVLARTGPVGSLIEFGANIGLNLRALRQLLPSVDLLAVEINPLAAQELRRLERVEVFEESIVGFSPPRACDCALVKGVLIHLAPECLAGAYDLLYHSSRRYICIAEYYNPTPVEVSYRGHKDRLFKRDFAGEMLDRFPDLRLVDCGFAYHRDSFPQDDLTWFLLEKAGARL